LYINVLAMIEEVNYPFYINKCECTTLHILVKVKLNIIY
jgi:hypothetical protein